MSLAHLSLALLAIVDQCNITKKPPRGLFCYNGNMKDFFFLTLGLVVILGSIFLFFTRSSVIENKTKIITINNTPIEVEVADTPQTRTQGLSEREGLLEGKGMLFIFEKPARYGFWMKNMNFAIDVVWIDDKFNIVDIDKEVSPETFPQVFHPDQKVKYVLELPAGYTNQHLIDIGTMVQF